MLPTLLMGLAVCAVWLPGISTRRGLLHPWHLVLAAALVAAVALGQATLFAAAFCVLASACGRLSVALPSTRARTALKVVTVGMCFALGIQKVGGFSPWIAVSDTLVSAHAGLTHVFLRIDAAVAGLLPLAFYTHRIGSLAELRAAWRPSVAIAAVSAACILMIGVAIGYVSFDAKLPWFTAIHLAHIALWTCPLEEGFFRGVVQGGLTRLEWVRSRPWLAPLPIVVSSLLFGVAHLKGGLDLVLLATLAGVCYGYAYHRTGRIEAAMLAHFSVDAAHFLWFTYPSLVPSI